MSHWDPRSHLRETSSLYLQAQPRISDFSPFYLTSWSWSICLHDKWGWRGDEFAFQFSSFLTNRAASPLLQKSLTICLSIFHSQYHQVSNPSLLWNAQVHLEGHSLTTPTETTSSEKTPFTTQLHLRIDCDESFLSSLHWKEVWLHDKNVDTTLALGTKAKN